MKRTIKGITVALNKIKPNIKNPRKGKYARVGLGELKDSLELVGQLTPLKVDEDFVLLAGHRRLYAMKELDWKECRVEVLKGLTTFQKSAVLISDNATQEKFDAYDNREAIHDMYWNEFLEEYVPKNNVDKDTPNLQRHWAYQYQLSEQSLHQWTKTIWI